MAVLGLAAALACFVDLVFVYSLDLSDWAPAIWPICFVIWLFMLLGLTVEWTIAGHELCRRGWLSRPGREPSTVMELGPKVGIVHETRSIWRFRPNGYLIGVPPWQNASLKSALERAGVRVSDWRDDWARRHRLLDAVGVLAFYGGLAGIIVMPTLGSHWSLFRAAAGFACSGAVFVGLAIDRLPWKMRKPSAQDTAGSPPPGPAPGGVWAQQVQVGPAPGLAFGGFWLRVAAYIFDVILLGIVGAILSSALGAAGQAMGALIFIAYFIGLWGTTGQTIGMMLLGLHVVRNLDGGKITWGHAVLRVVGLFVAFACIYIGVIWVAFDSRKRGWHDKVGGTVVVRNVGEGSANESTRRLNVRQGATAGIIVSFVVAASAAGSSTTHLQTFVSVLAVPLTVTAVVTVAALAINRQSSRPRDL